MSLQERSRRFSDICTENEIHGLAFQHITICPRRCWLHIHRLSYQHLDENIKKGLILHDLSQERDNSTFGLLGLAPDRVLWEENIVVESKVATYISDPQITQSAFYAIMLMAATGNIWSIRVNFLKARKNSDIRINETLMSEMEGFLQKIVNLKREENMPRAQRIPICSGCSEREFCWGERV